MASEASAVFRAHEQRIRDVLRSVEVRHVGGTSIAGVLTGGDVDLLVRVDADGFPEAREALTRLYEPFHLDAWHSEGAFFFAPDAEPPVEVALAVKGTLDDLHHGAAWQRLAADPALVEQYNAMKRRFAGRPEGEYNAAKREFFYANFRP